jgi:hypothetical protein
MIPANTTVKTTVFWVQHATNRLCGWYSGVPVYCLRICLMGEWLTLQTKEQIGQNRDRHDLIALITTNVRTAAKR